MTEVTGPLSSVMNLSLKKPLADWRKADLRARSAELTLRSSALDYESGGIAEIPQALIEAASKLRQAASDVLSLMLKDAPAGGS